MIRIFALLLSMLLISGAAIDGTARDRIAQNLAHATPEETVASKCRASGTTKIRIHCMYAAPTGGQTGDPDIPRIRLNQVAIEFRPREDSTMEIELTFTSDGGARAPEARTVYIAFDSEAGENLIRRPLPHVDLKKLTRGKPVTFTDALRVPALTPGRYAVHLWIPSTVPSLKFDAAHNMLLSNEGMADPTSGLNLIATIMVEKSDDLYHEPLN